MNYDENSTRLCGDEAPSQHMGGSNLIEKNIAMEKGNLASGEPHGRRLDVRPASEAL
jgi:hypothetical protein